jgi:hypothetical protein
VVDSSTHYDSDGKVAATRDVFAIGELGAFGKTWRDQFAHEYDHAKIPALIGPMYLLGRRFTLDYRVGLMAISESALPKIAGGTLLPMILSPDHEPLILVEGTVNGTATSVELDTGKSRTVVDPELISRMNLPDAPNGYRIDEIRLGQYRFSAPSAKKKGFTGISHGLEVPIGIGIGSDILSRMIVTVDYRERVVLLQDLEEASL